MSIEINTVPGDRIEPLYATFLKWKYNRGVGKRRESRKGKMGSEGITYIMANYNPSVRIIDLVSHTAYVVCVNFIHKWRDLQFKVHSERQIF